MRLGWYFNRLRSMGPVEILHRLREKQRKLVSRGRHEGWGRYTAPALQPVFPGLLDAVRTAGPAQRQAIALAAHEALAGRYAALGQQWPERGDPERLFPAALWALDPVSGKAWPALETYAFDIALSHDGSRGDIKYVWEINRLQFLPVLAAHAVLEPDDHALATIKDAIDSWHAANPPFRGVAWTSGIEIALRVISLIVAVELVGRDLDQATRRKVGEILAASAFWLSRFPSKYSSANNHRIAELAGEILIGFARGIDPSRAREAVTVEIQKQILADGAGAEQSPTYGAFTAELALLCALAARCSGRPFPPSFESRLGAFADFISWLGPNTFLFGDNDEGRVLTLGDRTEPDYPRSVAASIDCFLGKPGPTLPPGDFRALIFGMPSELRSAPQGLRTFPNGGLTVWHGEIAGRSVDLAFDHGPLGYLSIAAHGHADALSLSLNLDGMPVLVDPGTWLYASGGAGRDWFRSTTAHNTLNIAGANQSLIAGPFNWSHKAATTFVESQPEPNWQVRARHDGYRRRFGVLHQRTVELRGDGIAIVDQLIGGTRYAEIVFQLAPGLVAKAEGRTVKVMSGSEPLFAIEFPDPSFAIASGGDLPDPGGWVSPRFGFRLPAPRLAWRGQVGENGVTFSLTPITNVRR